MARVGGMRITEAGSKVSSEGRNVPNMVLQEKERNEQEGSHMACTSKREADLF